MTLPPNAIPIRRAVVTRFYGDWAIAVETDDVVGEVCDAVDAGATRITIDHPEDAA